MQTRRAIFTIDDKVRGRSVRSLMTHISQADFGVMVVSASHEQPIIGRLDISHYLLLQISLAKFMGLVKIIIAINQMDDPRVRWCRKKYEDINVDIKVLFSSFSESINEDFFICLPISAQHGSNIHRRVSRRVCPWWGSEYLYRYMDGIAENIPRRDPNADPFRMPINDCCGPLVAGERIVMGQIDGGHIQIGDDLLVLPHNVPVKVQVIYDSGEKPINGVGPGDKICVKLGGLQDFPSEKLWGSVLSSVVKPLSSVTLFSALLFDVTGPYNDDTRRIAEVGSKGHICIHNFMTNYEILGLREFNSKKTLIEKLIPGSWAVAKIEVEEPICIELEKRDHRDAFVTRSDRFILLGNEDKIIAVGKACHVSYKF